jgi:integrase
MPSVRANNGRLFFDFRYGGKRCREYTLLEDTPANRARVEKVLKRIVEEIARGTFDYAKAFPSGMHAPPAAAPPVVFMPPEPGEPATVAADRGPVPTLAAFAQTWFEEMSVGWRRTYRRTVQDILDRHLAPRLGAKALCDISKADLLAFRAEIAKLPGRGEGRTLSPKRVNGVMGIAKMLLDEAAERYGFPTPFRRIKRLPVARAEVEPFTLEEVRLILDSVRPEFRDYYIARFFTGMRTGELDGLKWKYVDFERRLILVRETVVAGEEDTTKTEYSKRDIAMSEIVYEALRRQFEVTGKRSVYVFATGSGDHFDHNNVTKRVWYPLLRLLNLKKRQPKQTRHTAATLWLAAGENPEWIARQMGHANTQMLFTVYSRFVPNLTHQDGSAFERLTQRVFESPGKAAPAADPTKPGEDA